MLRSRKYKSKHNSLAFTLIELLIVIGIAAIILTIAIPAWRSYYLRIVTVSAANTLCGDLRHTRMMSNQKQYFGEFSYNGGGYTYPASLRRGMSADSCYVCLAMNHTKRNTGSGSWGSSDVTENTIVTPLDSNIYFSNASNGAKLEKAYIVFMSQGTVREQSGFKKTDEGNYVIYVVCPGVISIPVTVMASGRVIVG
ncbi:prepilin-type N-terminal cleavage/methylation domain-containing protein [bacterium]|nr:prepilin-type N-terminal cleavage/methylation domain-containing protein [bacterium]